MKPPSSPSVITLSSGIDLTDKTHVRNLFSKTGLARLNFIADDFEATAGALDEIGEGFFSWYVLFGEAAKPAPQVGNIDERITNSLTSEEKEFLLKAWRLDYADSILSAYSAELRDSQVSTLLERLEEGIHHVYRHEGRIVGHGCWVEDLHSVYPVRCLYWHQWVNREIPSNIRTAIHSRFFSALKLQELPSMSGVAVVNKRAFKHCLRNGMKPVMISVRKLCV